MYFPVELVLMVKAIVTFESVVKIGKYNLKRMSSAVSAAQGYDAMLILAAATMLHHAGRARDLAGGAAQARAALTSGRARARFEAA